MTAEDAKLLDGSVFSNDAEKPHDACYTGLTRERWIRWQWLAEQFRVLHIPTHLNGIALVNRTRLGWRRLAASRPPV